MAFDPNRLTFDDGIQRIQKALSSESIKVGKRIVTSRDRDVAKVMDRLQVTNVPKGFSKWQLPVWLNGPSQMFLTVAEPGAQVPEHSHNEGDGIRFIMS